MAGVPAKVRRELRDEQLDHIRRNAEVYRDLTRQHLGLTHGTA